jgi:beta-ureidopropionase
MPRLGLVQMRAGPDKDANVEHAMMLVRRAAAEGAQILCLPEVFFSEFKITELDYAFFEMAETVPGPTTERVGVLARELGVVVIAPVYERVGRSVYYNTAAVMDADGTLVGIYRKQHIPMSSLFYEKLYFKPGNLGYPVFQTRFGRVGVYICHDRHYPEGARILALRGAEVILIPVATPTASLSVDVFELEIRAHAVFNEVFVAAVNRVGTEGQLSYYGRSLICDPDGQVLSQAGSEEEILCTDMDFALIDRRRLLWQFYRDRRPHTYGALTEETP